MCTVMYCDVLYCTVFNDLLYIQSYVDELRCVVVCTVMYCVKQPLVQPDLHQ